MISKEERREERKKGIKEVKTQREKKNKHIKEGGREKKNIQ